MWDILRTMMSLLKTSRSSTSLVPPIYYSCVNITLALSANIPLPSPSPLFLLYNFIHIKLHLRPQVSRWIHLLPSCWPLMLTRPCFRIYVLPYVLPYVSHPSLPPPDIYPPLFILHILPLLLIVISYISVRSLLSLSPLVPDSMFGTLYSRLEGGTELKVSSHHLCLVPAVGNH